MKRTLCGFALIVLGAIGPHLLIAETDASLFKAKCALCHGEDGGGNTPTGKAQKAKDLRSEETQKKSDAEIAEVITKGRNKMPAFGQKLKPDQIQQLVAYIRQLPKK
jgi:mono/diheme cytochrome c family protein